MSSTDTCWQIALGTLILLTGVLGLSWRLHGDATSGSSVAQTPLSPDLIFVDDDTSDRESVESKISLEGTTLIDKETPTDTRSPTSQNPRRGNMLSRVKGRRKHITEQQEIWEELAHDTLPPLSPLTNRRVSLLAGSSPSSKRGSQMEPPETDDEATEDTGLLTRSGTGRNYRDPRRRRSTVGFEIQGRQRGARSVSNNSFLSGWFTKASWKKTDKSKGKNRVRSTSSHDIGDNGGTLEGGKP